MERVSRMLTIGRRYLNVRCQSVLGPCRSSQQVATGLKRVRLTEVPGREFLLQRHLDCVLFLEKLCCRRDKFCRLVGRSRLFGGQKTGACSLEGMEAGGRSRS